MRPRSTHAVVAISTSIYPLDTAKCHDRLSDVREFNTGATRDSDKPNDPEGFLSPLVLARFTAYMAKHRVQADGKLRASDNWQKGIPIDVYQKSLIRHVFAAWLTWRTGLEDETLEDSLCAIIFNTQGMLHELLRERVPL
jgi:hypothetical protein